MKKKAKKQQAYCASLAGRSPRRAKAQRSKGVFLARQMAIVNALAAARQSFPSNCQQQHPTPDRSSIPY